MANGLGVKILSYDDLRRTAASFLDAYHPVRSLPIPIEEIIDLRFKLDIIPTPGLLEHFDIDAQITSDLTTI